ncbi:MAG: DUF3179 domain-containing protein [Anaerolineae bacterium]|nr:DUF3179 domain-containing protein [Anaerolineae bacterium]
MIGKFVIEDFDLQRAIIREYIVFEPLLATDSNTISLQKAVEQALIKDDDALIVFSVNQSVICISLVNMIYFHVAQGVADNTAWMVSFCVVCNAGMLFSPVVNGEILHFADGGFYNAMTLLTDKETRSIWNHITGHCLHGVHKGVQLTHLGAPLQKTASQVITEYPNAIFIHSQLSDENAQMVQQDNINRLNPDLKLSTRAMNTLRLEDERLPRFDMGLGIWTVNSKKFYPYRKIVRENAIIDLLDGRKILVYVSPVGVAPEAIYTSATSFEWLDDILKLDNGQTIRDGVLYDAEGQIITAERPQQLFQRWYSFTLLFDDCEIC